FLIASGIPSSTAGEPAAQRGGVVRGALLEPHLDVLSYPGQHLLLRHGQVCVNRDLAGVLPGCSDSVSICTRLPSR
ncbi:MAG: hypothetical protein JOY78_12190, partial [Pseudonocardia sp.]|nr:hypothetical protein [Pseudonocardia sp.]